MTVSIAGIPKGKVLAALYNNSKSQGMGFLAFTPAPTPMTEAEADELLKQDQYFDYLKGRVMKVNLAKDDVSPWGYDRDIGQGEFARVIEELRTAEVGKARA